MFSPWPRAVQPSIVSYVGRAPVRSTGALRCQPIWAAVPSLFRTRVRKDHGGQRTLWALIVATEIAGVVFGREAPRVKSYGNSKPLAGQTGATAIQTVIESANRPKLGTIASAIGIGTVLVGTSGAFLGFKTR